ncbi:MAG: ATP-dependent DNA helicase [Magnetococcales bacterium]|nr:ATP-dependent DNA helicase [Magnetococcales bacterium]
MSQREPRSETDHLIETLFGPESLLSQTIPFYESRAVQVHMARQVADIVLSEGALMVEAATGTGKTLAYLLPLLALGQKVIVATATKALQDQIIGKDLPMVRRVMRTPFTFASLKGRGNYLCLLRFRSFSLGGGVQPKEKIWLERVKGWVGETCTGDRDELTQMPERLSFWYEISAGGDHCVGRQCEEYDACFLNRARNQAKKVDLVVVNHHLFFADLAVKEGGFGEILPRHEVVVFDEAHRIPDVVTTFFGWEISNYKIRELIQDSRREYEEIGADDPLLYDTLPGLEEAAHRLRAAFPVEDCRDGLLAADVEGEPGRAMVAVEEALYHYRQVLEPHRIRSVTLSALFRRAEELLEISGRIRSLGDVSRVHWFETRGRGVFLHASPLETGPTLRALLYPTLKSVIFTSATLVTGSGKKGFAFFEEQLGLAGEKVVKEQLPPPFNYSRQALLFVPNDLPEPNHPAYPAAVAQEINNLLQLSRGRALCLFTSLRMMESVRAALQQQLPYTLLVQGDQTKGALLERFKADISSVLLGVASFWEGVDIPGESLSMVVVDRLPFASPGDPLVAARGQWIASQKLNPFNVMSVPRAIISLKQGLGRLLRRGSDRGVMVVLDGRIVSKWYGKRFFSGLPPIPLTHDRQAVRQFFSEDPPPDGRDQKRVDEPTEESKNGY